MVRVIAHNYIGKEHLDKANELFREMIAATLKEDGCIEYTLQMQDGDDTHYVFIEAWESEEALKAHFETEHFKRIIPQIKEFCYKDEPVTLLAPFA